MVTRSMAIEWNETLKNLFMPWRKFTAGGRWRAMRSRRVHNAHTAEKTKGKIARALKRDALDAKELKRELRKFTHAQEREAEAIRETIYELIPSIIEARRRIAELTAELNRLTMDPELREAAAEARKELQKARDNLHRAINDVFLTINEQRLGRA